MEAVRGSLLYFTGNPFYQDVKSCMRYESDGVLVIKDGIIQDVGPADRVLKTLPQDTEVTRYSDRLIMPGFIDTHTHYVQLDIMASFGNQLIDWLEQYTFPAEQKFADKAHADYMAGLFCDQLLLNGTTTASVFCATYPQSVDALFEVAEQRGMRMIAGKVIMDRNGPETLLDTVQSSYDDSKKLVEKWHGRGRLSYALTPRFAPTSSVEQLEAMGALKQENPTVHIQSHISENREEIDWVKKLFPGHLDYLDIYDHFGLLGERTILGHGIHLEQRELARLSETKTALSHCPSSNLFLGSGIFDLEKIHQKNRPVKLGIGTDVGAGTSFSMLQTLQDAYKVSQLNGRPMTAAEGFYLTTLGGAEALGISHHVGTFRKGLEADYIVINPKATDLMARRVASAESIEDLLFCLMILGDDRIIQSCHMAS